MLMISLAASAMIAAPQPVQQNAASPNCEAQPYSVSFEVRPEGGRPVTTPRLPGSKSDARDPAQALPECKEEPVKRRKRKSDYPMA